MGNLEGKPNREKMTSVKDGDSTDGMDQGWGAIAALSTTEGSIRRRDSPGKELEKSILYASEAFESLHNSEPERSDSTTPEDNVTQKWTENPMAKDCIEIVDKNASE